MSKINIQRPSRALKIKKVLNTFEFLLKLHSGIKRRGLQQFLQFSLILSLSHSLFCCRVKNGLFGFGLPFVAWYENLYLIGLIPLYLYTELGHSLLGLQTKLPFIPLMMTSLYCSVGIIWSWLVLYVDFLLEKDDTVNNKVNPRTKLKSR